MNKNIGFNIIKCLKPCIQKQDTKNNKWSIPIQIWIYYVIYKLTHSVNHLTCSDILQWGGQQSHFFCMSLFTQSMISIKFNHLIYNKTRRNS
jgi:hypothetical protein